MVELANSALLSLMARCAALYFGRRARYPPALPCFTGPVDGVLLIGNKAQRSEPFR